MWRCLLFLLACKDPQAKPVIPADATRDAPGRVAADPCEASAKQLSDRLETLSREKPGALPAVIIAELPRVPEAKLVDTPGAVVMLAEDDRVVVAGTVVTLRAAPAEIQEKIVTRSLRALISERTPDPPWMLYVWADRDARAASLTKLLAGHDSRLVPRLLVLGDTTAPPDPHPPTGDEAAAVEARAVRMRAAYRGCGTMPAAFATASEESGAVNELTVLAHKVPQAIADCRCALSDRATFESSMLSIFGAYQPTPKWIEMPKPKKGNRTIGELVSP